MQFPTLRTLSIVASTAALLSVGLLASAAPPNGLTQQQQPRISDQRQLDRQRVAKPQVPLEDQVKQLRSLVSGLQEQINTLRNDQQNGSNDDLAQLDDRLETLESVVRITPGVVKIVSDGRVEIRSQAQLDIIASGRVQLTGADARVNAPLLTATGILRADAAILESVTSISYTPGIGNIW